VSTNSDVFIYDIATKTTINISEGMKGYDRNPLFSPDGSKLAWNSMEREGYESDRNRIMIHDFNTNTTYELTEGLDRNAGHFEWSEDGSKMYFLSGEQATAQLYEINLKNKELRQITSGDHDYVDFAFAGNRIIGGRMSMSQPVELFSINPKNGKTEQLTRINEEKLNSIELGRVEKRWIKTTDNKDMLTWVIYPPDFDPTKKYPTLLYCQGGPQSTVSQFFSYRWNFQLMAANGYIVVAPNRRGLPSFGQEWNEQISGDWGGQAMKDYLSAIDAVKQEPYVDEERLGAVGASFGGYSVYWLAGNHDNRFKALIAHCGLFNLTSWYGTTEELFFANWDLGGPYWEDELQDEYERFSPHTYVENWTAPILVIHGEKDFRVPVSEGIQAFHAAQIRNVPSRFLYFPEEGHWVLSPQNGVLWHRVFFDWLDQWMK
jgi:dipeptidyl aminopeptidase/acylaminoacyl peptidase